MSKYKSTYISGDLTLIHHLSGDVITSDCSGTTIACLRVVRTNSVAVTIVYNASRTRAVKLRNLTKLKTFLALYGHKTDKAYSTTVSRSWHGR